VGVVWPEQGGSRVPGIVFAIAQSTLVGHEGQQDPDRFFQCAGEVSDAGVDGNGEAQIRDRRGGVKDTASQALLGGLLRHYVRI